MAIRQPNYGEHPCHSETLPILGANVSGYLYCNFTWGIRIDSVGDFGNCGEIFVSALLRNEFNLWLRGFRNVAGGFRGLRPAVPGFSILGSNYRTPGERRSGRMPPGVLIFVGPGNLFGNFFEPVPFFFVLLPPIFVNYWIDYVVTVGVVRRLRCAVGAVRLYVVTACASAVAVLSLVRCVRSCVRCRAVCCRLCGRCAGAVRCVVGTVCIRRVGYVVCVRSSWRCCRMRSVPSVRSMCYVLSVRRCGVVAVVCVLE